MFRTILRGLALVTWAWLSLSPVSAQVRMTPREAMGGQPQGEPWAEAPEGFRNLKIQARQDADAATSCAAGSDGSTSTFGRKRSRLSG
jgi:hypothetical protein